MSGPNEKKGSDSAGPKQDKRASNKDRESQQHEDNVQIIGALNGLADKITAATTSENTAERGKATREVITIILVFLTFAAAIAGDAVFYLTMRDARNAAANAHGDNGLALGKAGDALTVATDTEKRQLRAYVSAAPMEIVANALDAKTPPLWHFVLKGKNGGQTPTRGASITSQCGLGKDASHVKWGAPTTWHKNIGAQSETLITDCAKTANELAWSKRVGFKTFVNARVEYSDVFGEKRITRICNYVDFLSDPASAYVPPQFIVASCEPSCEDEECRGYAKSRTPGTR